MGKEWILFWQPQCFTSGNATGVGRSVEWGSALVVLISGTPCSSGRAALQWCFAYGLFCFFWIPLHSRMEGSSGGSTRPNLGWGRCQDLLCTRPVCKIHMTTWPCSKSTWKPCEVKECVGYRPRCLFKLPNQKFNLTLPPCPNSSQTPHQAQMLYMIPGTLQNTIFRVVTNTNL